MYHYIGPCSAVYPWLCEAEKRCSTVGSRRQHSGEVQTMNETLRAVLAYPQESVENLNELWSSLTERSELEGSPFDLSGR